ncbi:hypothetical protein DOTSEDRAFT_27485 [Dothistroma septosporum NZE10]|uniref:RING-type domain-containing protein n=1 Tax=Dothistroma septosporum (strain NZE10 / CBS 128990) TaxID=675120 RepID=N1PFK1_DOTSN|nr:hypothetical protein DOTSEDRAFT_27485 [Dothistroma septosporum NZE10]
MLAQDSADEAPKKKQKKKLRRRGCIICCNDVATNRFPRTPHRGAREHGRDVGFKCQEQHLHSQIEGTDWDKISCAQWLDKAAKSCRESDEKFRECSKADYSWGCFMTTKTDGNIFRCQLCEYCYCVVCEAPMHENQTCEVYQAQKAEREQEIQEQEHLSMEQVKNISKPCPKCKSAIMKDGGYDQMTCKRCKHEFCWLCFAGYNGPEGIRYRGDSCHDKSCTYHSDNLPAAQANTIFPTVNRAPPI